MEYSKVKEWWDAIVKHPVRTISLIIAGLGLVFVVTYVQELAKNSATQTGAEQVEANEELPTECSGLQSQAECDAILRALDGASEGDGG